MSVNFSEPFLASPLPPPCTRLYPELAPSAPEMDEGDYKVASMYPVFGDAYNITYSAPTVIAQAAPTAPLASKVGIYDGKPIIELKQTGKRYVVYERNDAAAHLVAMPYGGWATLRSVQSVAVAALAILAAGIIGCALIAFTATPIGWSVIAIVAIAFVVLGVGLLCVWKINHNDPAAQYADRQEALKDQKVNSEHLTSDVEKRQMLFTKRYASLKTLAKDFRALNSNQISAAERQFFRDQIIPQESALYSLESEYERKLAPVRNYRDTVIRQARDSYEYSSAVQMDRMLDTTHSIARLSRHPRDRRYEFSDGLTDGAYIAGKAINQYGVEREARRRDEMIMGADIAFNQGKTYVRQGMNFDARKRAIIQAAFSAFDNFKRTFVVNDGSYSDANVSGSVYNAILTT